MELSALLNAGAVAAIAANALNSMVALIVARLRGADAPSAQDQLLLLLVHVLAGVGLGFIFWLSWGFTAIVAVPWWQRGAAFALLLWAALCIPQLLHVAIVRQTSWRSAIGAAAQWLTTLLTVGMACAWSWQHGP